MAAFNFISDVCFNQFQATKMVLENGVSDPGTPTPGQIYFNTGSGFARFRGTSNWVVLRDDWVALVAATLPVVVSGTVANPVLSINPASGSLHGSMSASDFTKLGASTNAATGSTIVMRDVNGDFLARNITAALLGNATTSTTANNIAAGAAGSLPYQASGGSTSLLPAGSSTQVLVSGSSPTWTNTPTLTGTNFTGIPGTGINSIVANATLAINADNLDSQHGAWYQSRFNHTDTQLASTISDFNTAVRTNRLDQMTTPTSAVGMGGQKLTNLADPTVASDAVTKFYADNLKTGIIIKDPVVAASSADVVVATAPATLDGITLVSGNRILLWKQTIASQNGIYVFTTAGAALTRSIDADNVANGAEVVNGIAVWSQNGGTVNGGQKYTLTTANPIVLGTTALSFQADSSIMYLSAGGASGLTITGTTITANIDATMEISGNALRHKSVAAISGQSAQILKSGGTGNPTAWAAYKYMTTFGDGSAQTFVITHNLSTKDVVVSIRTTAGDSVVMAPWSATSTNTITISVSNIPSAAQYTVVVMG